MFPGMPGLENQLKSIDPDQLRQQYRFRIPMWLVYALSGFTVVRLYGFAFKCYRAPLSPVFDAVWAFWFVLLLVPVGMGFANYYTDKDPVQPWQINMLVGLALIAILAIAGTRMMQGVC